MLIQFKSPVRLEQSPGGTRALPTHVDLPRPPGPGTGLARQALGLCAINTKQRTEPKKVGFVLFGCFYSIP